VLTLRPKVLGHGLVADDFGSLATHWGSKLTMGAIAIVANARGGKFAEVGFSE
jgi:hypothetical protein